MESQEKLFKGELREEQLRSYFIGLGFYVVRGVKFIYDKFEVTDVDLWLYNKQSTLSRERINVDVKNRRAPQALERIFWTKGLQNVLGLDNCIVVTTDRRNSIVEFGLKHGVKVLNDNLNTYSKEITDGRMNEEDFLNLLRKGNQYIFNWKTMYEKSKTRLLSGLDFSGVNETLDDLNSVYKVYITDAYRKEEASRLIYVLISHLLVSIDYIFKDLTFYDYDTKANKLSDGLRYGNLGRAGLDNTLRLAMQISNESRSRVEDILALYDRLPVDVLKDFFIKTENSERLFKWARSFEYYAFGKTYYKPDSVHPELQAILLLLVDYFGYDRRNFMKN